VLYPLLFFFPISALRMLMGKGFEKMANDGGREGPPLPSVSLQDFT
jgi:hypothetical protein